MMEVNLKSLVLDNEADTIYDYLDNDYQKTINDFFTLLLEEQAIGNYTNVELLFQNIESIITNEQNDHNLKIIKEVICDTNKVFNLIKIDKTKKENRFFKFKLVDLNRIIIETKKTNQKRKDSETYNFIMDLIFVEKDLSLIEKYLFKENKIIEIEHKGKNILEKILEHYLTLDENNIEEIEYFTSIIDLFLLDENIDYIMKKKTKYLQMLENNSKLHINVLNSRFISLFQVDTKKLEKKYDVHFNFPKEVTMEANNITPILGNRNNFLNQNPVTIDCAATRCLDDAIYLQKNSNGTWTLFTHIMDIPSLVKYGSIINIEAKNKGEQLYLFDRDIPIYPDIITTNLGSLLPYQDKRVFTYSVDFDGNFNLIPETFNIRRGLIYIKNRLTYDGVDNQFTHLTNSQLDTMLNSLWMISSKLKNINKGKENYRKIENIISKNVMHHSLYTDNSISNNIVQEIMILTNHLIPKYMKEHDLPYDYRIHIPTDDKLINLIIANNPDILDNRYNMAQNINLIKNSYLNARYSPICLPHKGLGLEPYSHSTSPGWRYMDSFGQYIIEDLVINGNTSDKNIYLWENRVKETCNYINERQNLNHRFESEYNSLASKKLIRKK